MPIIHLTRELTSSCLPQAFHGNHVAVYIKAPNADKNKFDVKWERHVLEDFGPLNSEFTGSIHYVTCVDIDGDGVDELLVAMMGSNPPSWKRTGVWCFKRTYTFIW
jgi:hypothetical protein